MALKGWITIILLILVVYSVAGNLMMMTGGIPSVPVWQLRSILIAEFVAFLLAGGLSMSAAVDHRRLQAGGYLLLALPPLFFMLAFAVS